MSVRNTRTECAMTTSRAAVDYAPCVLLTLENNRFARFIKVGEKDGTYRRTDAGAMHYACR